MRVVSGFAQLISRMKTFLQRFIKVISDSERKHDLNSKRMQDLNALLYEYEKLSLTAYSPARQSSSKKVNETQEQ